MDAPTLSIDEHPIDKQLGCKPSSPNNHQLSPPPATQLPITSDAIQIEPETISTCDEQSTKSKVTSDLDQTNSNQKESNIKLKRCKHGRIIIKDLSKKKLVQHSDIEANNICASRNESNNNHIATCNNIQNDLHDVSLITNDPDIKAEETIKQTSRDDLVETIVDQASTVHVDDQAQTCPLKSTEVSLVEKSKDERNSRHSHRSNSRGSSSSSVSQPRKPCRERSPPRKSRRSRSPVVRDRNRARGRDSNYRRESLSSDRSSGSSIPRRRRSRRSPGRRRYGSSSRHRHSDDHRLGRRSPACKSSPRGVPRSRSATPSRRDHRSRHSRQDRSPNRSRYSRHSNHEKRDVLNRQSKTDSLREPRQRTEHSEHGLKESGHSEGEIMQRIKAPEGDISPQARVISEQNHSHQSDLSRLTKEAAQPKTSPKDALQPRSPMTPCNDNSASSDIYDPEGPIIAISPGDSPPISPINDVAFDKRVFHTNNVDKTGEDDVPSSAVQLNQQEKYLQKLNRQERVVEEVKIALKPFYQNRTIDKNQYKDVLRRAVPKICHSKNGEINPIKIRSLVEKYVSKMR